MTTEQKLLDAAADAFAVDRATLTVSSSRDDVPTWDSWGHVALVSAVEETFSISLPVEDVVAFETLGDVLAALRRQGLA